MTDPTLSELEPITITEADSEMIPDHGLLRGSTVVDVGCGTGDMVRWFRSQGARAIGVDSAEMVTKARAAAPELAGDLLEGAGEQLPLGSASADLVLFLASFHHVPVDAMDTALAEAARVLRPGGRVVIIEPVAAEGAYTTLTSLVEDERAVLAVAKGRIGRHQAFGLEMVEESYFGARRRLANYRRLLEVFVTEASVRERCTDEAERITRVLAETAGCAPEDFVYLSVCRRTVLRKCAPSVS